MIRDTNTPARELARPRDLERLLDPAIDEERIATNWQRIAQARRPATAPAHGSAHEPARPSATALPRASVRRSIRWFAVATAAAVVAAAVYLAWPSRGGPLSAIEIAIAPGSVVDAPARRTVAFDDGSALELADGARLEVLTNESDRFALLLVRGHARFDVQPGGPRRWEIETSRATVEVVGTAFIVESDDRRVVVAVERGVVMVRGERVPGRVARLVAGGRLEIDDSASASGPHASTTSDNATTDRANANPASTSATAATDRANANPATTGANATTDPATTKATTTNANATTTNANATTDRASANPTIASTNRRKPPSVIPGKSRRVAATDAPRDEHGARATSDSKKLAAILGEVEQRRASGDAAGAAELLEAAVSSTRDDPSLGLAEFTLGRLYLEELGAPDRAAAAFAKMIALGSPHALLEDAYARRIEALVRALRTDDARAALAEYDRLYPHGLRRAALHALLP